MSDLRKCYGCSCELKSGDIVYPYHEHYICVSCTPMYISETGRPIIIADSRKGI